MKIVTVLYKTISSYKDGKLIKNAFSKSTEPKWNSGEKPTKQTNKQKPHWTIPVGSNYLFQALVASFLH